jgi:hypothetical protein
VSDVYLRGAENDNSNCSDPLDSWFTATRIVVDRAKRASRVADRLSDSSFVPSSPAAAATSVSKSTERLVGSVSS